MVAITRPYEKYLRDKPDKDSVKVRCATCKGVLFIAGLTFRDKKHDIKIKCRKCGYINKL